MIFVIGFGYGVFVVLVVLWFEGLLERFYFGEYDFMESGFYNLVMRFFVLGGFLSYINVEILGVIYEGGELGYVLGVVFGVVMDKFDLVVMVVVGDGEVEMGLMVMVWYVIKFLDLKELGVVILILYVNGFKISERIIFGCMDDKEIVVLFSGYGY